MLEVTDATFEADVVEASWTEPVLVDVWAPWCGPCRALSPILGRLADEFGDRIRFTKLDSDENPEAARQLGVRGIPFVLMFVDGKPVDSFVGLKSESEIRAFIEKFLPGAGAQDIAAGRRARAQGLWPDAATRFQTALAADPDNAALRAETVEALARSGDAAAARAAYAPLAGSAAFEPRIAALGQLVAAAEGVADLDPARREAIEARADQALEKVTAAGTGRPQLDREDLDALLGAARIDWLASRWQRAIDRLLAIVRADRGFDDDVGRRTLIALFEFCPDPGIVAAARRRLAAALN